MSMMPMVSVLMTAYNREKYLGFAIESVIASTYGNWELIIVDDVSKDGTIGIARSYAEKDGRIRVFRNETNLGDYPNRNKAAGYARGKYLKYVDADDYLYPWGLELLVKMMEENPEAGWGLCSLIQITARPYPFLLTGRQAYEYHYGGYEIFNKAPLSAIIRKDAFEAAGGFSGIRMAGDFEMWHRMALHFPVLLMPDGIVWYREHGEQEMNSHRQFLAAYEGIRHRYLTHPECPLPAETARKLIRKRKRDLIRTILAHAFRLRFAYVAANSKALSYYIGK
ncbi:MAG TPA: glycosyltransferase family 2 protein [Puia sp.]|nr:glycosyltransferase family 2 protein [Puia sp.]